MVAQFGILDPADAHHAMMRTPSGNRRDLRLQIGWASRVPVRKDDWSERGHPPPIAVDTRRDKSPGDRMSKEAESLFGTVFRIAVRVPESPNLLRKCNGCS